MKTFNFLITTLFLFISITCQSQPVVDKGEVEKTLKILSADSMGGRKTFTPGIDKAANYIKKEFEKIGLVPLGKAIDFEDKFNPYFAKPTSISGSLNGKPINPAHAFIIGVQKKIEWTKGNILIDSINSTTSFQEKVSSILKKKSNQLILVHPSQKETFELYKKHLDEGTTSIEKTETSKVFVLTDKLKADDFKINIDQNVQEQKAANIVGVLPGKSKIDEYVIFSAHYDHLGVIEATNNDSIANGADDDASGTTAVISLARYFKKLNNNERTIIFVAFTAEEIGGYGSKHFSKQLNPDKIVAMLNIEMIGKESKFGPNTAFITGFERSDFGKILQKNTTGTKFAFHPDPYPEQNLFYRSDNATLAKLGVPAHSISTDQIDSDKLYHSVDDEFESINIQNLVNTIDGIITGSKTIISGKDTPTRLEKVE